FRELAVSYLGRFDLAHVDPTQAGFDALGRGVEEGKPAAPVSKGLTRSRSDKLVVMSGGAAPEGRGAAADARAPSPASPGGTVTGLAGGGGRGAIAAAVDIVSGAANTAQQPVKLGFSRPDAFETSSVVARRVEAKSKGYEGEACGE